MEGIASLIATIANGGPTGIIALLGVAVIYLVWERVRLYKLIDKYRETIHENRNQYSNSIINVINQYHEGNKELIKALDEIKIVLITLQKNHSL